jgi:BirA family biotin operon repressor/biotin-[acetyl-CoA-carboxylase] ligase
VDADGQLIVRTDSGEEKVFTGEVSVHGIYGAV